MVSTTLRNEKLVITIENGCQEIPGEQLGQIWESFELVSTLLNTITTCIHLSNMINLLC